MKSIFNVIAGPEKDTCCILMYGEIGTYADVTAQDVVTQIMEADNTYKNIDIRINSVGGEVAAGIAIFNAIRQAKANITIYIDCIAASTASFIAGCGRKVKMGRYARMMLHRPTGGVYGNADQLKSYIDQLQQIEDILCDIYANRTGMSVDEIKEKYMDGADHWLTAQEALDLGFVDEIFDDTRKVNFEDCLTDVQRCEKYTACYITDVLHKNENPMLEKLRKLPMFVNCADGSAIMDRLTEIHAKAQERDALKTKVDAFEKKQKDALEKEVKDTVNDAVLDGRINETERAAYEAMLMSDQADSARKILASLKPTRKVVVNYQGGEGKQTLAEKMHARTTEVKAKLV